MRLAAPAVGASAWIREVLGLSRLVGIRFGVEPPPGRPPLIGRSGLGVESPTSRPGLRRQDSAAPLNPHYYHRPLHSQPIMRFRAGPPGGQEKPKSPAKPRDGSARTEKRCCDA